MRRSNKLNILWIDCIGGLVVGLIILSLAPIISRLDSLPQSIVFFVGFANLTYGSYSLWLTTRTQRALLQIKILAFANIAWLFVCVTIIMIYFDKISAFGVFHKLAEGIYVATLGVLELKWRHSLAK